jgi:hypothetical protein
MKVDCGLRQSASTGTPAEWHSSAISGYYRKSGPQAQNEPMAEPSTITAASAMIGPTIAAMTMSK